jgi:hypothetical protein
MIAALFVRSGSHYFGRPDVDPWPESRDARLYAGPHPVVCHPPCARWGRLYAMHGGKLGDDNGCFESALQSLRRWGGVLEHPADSFAWSRFGLPRPRRVRALRGRDHGQEGAGGDASGLRRGAHRAGRWGLGRRG